MADAAVRCSTGKIAAESVGDMEKCTFLHMRQKVYIHLKIVRNSVKNAKCKRLPAETQQQSSTYKISNKEYIVDIQYESIQFTYTINLLSRIPRVDSFVLNNNQAKHS
jgi:hypothetical protein